MALCANGHLASAWVLNPKQTPKPRQRRSNGTPLWQKVNHQATRCWEQQGFNRAGKRVALVEWTGDLNLAIMGVR